jgi:hypothetical protein
MFQIGQYSLTSSTMSTEMNATISPDRAAGDPLLFPDTMQRSSRVKRRHEEANTQHDGTGTRTGPAAKVARLADANEEAKAQEGDETPASLLTTEKIMDLLKDLWSDDKCVIQRVLTEIADIGCRDSSPYENEEKIRLLGGHTAVFHLLCKHVGCPEIQQQGMRALGNFCRLKPTKKLLVDIGYVEVILARMEKYPKSERAQRLGCFDMAKLIPRLKGNAERVEKSGGIAVVIAAMKTHQNSEMVQISGCRALYYMSEWEEYRPLIVKAGGASAIASIMEKHWDQSELYALANNSMKRLFK